MSESESHPLSAEGVRSYDYVRWKEETLANQTSHKVTQNLSERNNKIFSTRENNRRPVSGKNSMMSIFHGNLETD